MAETELRRPKSRLRTGDGYRENGCILFGTGDGNDAGGSTNGGKTKEVDARTFVVSSAKYITIDYSTVTKELNNIEDVLKSGNVPSATSSKYVSFLGDTRSQLLEQKQLDEEFAEHQPPARFAGEMPKEGEEELPIIAENAKNIMKRRFIHRAESPRTIC